MNMGLNFTFWALIWFDGILIKIGEEAEELQLFNMYHPLFQGNISNWTIAQRLYHGQMWAIQLLFLHNLSR